MKKVCAIVVAFNNPNELEDVFFSLASQTYPIKKIICIDNSNDTYQSPNQLIVNRFRAKIVIDYVINDGVKGSAEGFRKGMELALAEANDFVWLNDQDGLPSSTCLENLVKAYKENNMKPGIYSPLIIAKEGDYILPNFHANFNVFKHTIRINLDDMDNMKIADYSGTTGNLIHYDLMKMCGIYNSKAFFVGLEDIEYCNRIKAMGYELYLVRDAKYKHPDLYLKYSFKMSAVSRMIRRFKMEKFSPLFLGDVRQLKNGDFNTRECYFAVGNAYINTMYCSKYAQYINYIYSFIRLLFIKTTDKNVNIKKSLELYHIGKEYANADRELIYFV